MRRLMILLALVGTGCARPLLYEPAVTRADKAPEVARKQLDAVIRRATLPRVGNVAITEKVLSWQYAVLGPFDIELGRANWVSVPWVTVGWVDIYDNKRAFLYDKASQERGWLQFATLDDAKAFSDLVRALELQARQPPRPQPPRKKP